MEQIKKYEELNAKAVKFFKENNITHTAVAISGSEESLVLLNAAVAALGNENVLAIAADTGYVSAKVLSIIEKACDMVNVDRCILPVYLRENAENAQSTSDYKQQIFEEMLQECWLLGCDVLSYACTEENISIDGNEVIGTFDGTVAPFV